MINQRQLHHALTLCKHANFHRAAEAAGISQPALSRSVRALENSLGVKLFDRTTHKVTPTPHFENVLRHAENIMTEADELERVLQFSKGPDFGDLTVAMGAHAAEVSGGKTIVELARAFPRLNLLVDECYWQIVGEQVLNRSVEIGYANTSPAYPDQLKVETIARHEPVFFCRDNHPLLLKGPLSNDDLRAYPMAKVRFQSGVEEKSSRLARRKRNAETGRIFIEVSNLAMARTIVSETDCFAMSTPIQIEPWLRSGEFKVLPYSAASFPLNYGFITLRERTLSPAAHEFMKLARLIEEELAKRNRDLVKRYAPSKD